MKQFHFRLERLLEIRAFRERQWLAKLAEATGQCVRLGRRIRANVDARREAFGTEARRGPEQPSDRGQPSGRGQPDGRGQPSGRTLDMELLAYREHYITRLGVENRRLQEELDKRNRQRDEVQKQYLEASKDRKILDKLKERRSAEYRLRSRREEFKAQDELSCDRHIRSREG